MSGDIVIENGNPVVIRIMDTPSNPESLTSICHSIADLDDLDQWAKALTSKLLPGDVLALNGPMGSGKTTLTQKLGKHLGLKEKITSPTFVLIHEYLTGTIPVIHVDLYRLGEENAEGLAPELLELLEERTAIVIVEWAEYGAFLQPYITFKLDLDYVLGDVESENQRTIQLTTDDPRFINKDFG